MIDADSLLADRDLDDRLAAVCIDGGSTALRVTARRSGSTMLACACGVVDLSTVASWRQSLATLVAVITAPGLLVVDLDDVEFMGACGYAALAEVSQRCRRRGIAFGLVGQSPTMARTIGICQWDTDLPVYPDVDAARRASGRLKSSA